MVWLTSEGNGDVTSNPLLDATTFALGNGSPAIDAGTPNVPGIDYRSTPNIGSH